MIEEALLSRIKKICIRLDISPTQFGVKSVNDPNLVADLEDGRELRHGTRLRVEKYLANLCRKNPRL